MKHPTPWRVEQTPTQQNRGYADIVDSGNPPKSVLQFIDLALADRIAVAVNAHDQLMAAVEASYKALRELGGTLSETMWDDCFAAEQKCSDALADVEKTT